MDQFFLNNAIYKYLTDKKSSILVSIIDTTYQQCEYILGEIPKEFSNYTIHDIHHAIRVINYMTEFVKPNINEYSDFHLALILLSGLLHDTGMFVSDEEKGEILSRIITEDNKDHQQDVFQDYIRERHAKRVRKILDNYVIDEDTDSKFSSIFRLDSYNFSDEIALICQSHTEPLEWIKDTLSEFEVLTDYEYNPQQIAFLLKIGDNLDIDARRAPYSLLKLLKIKGYSETEWKKHSPINNYEKIELKDNCFHIFFTGRCNNQFIYRNVMEHLIWLEKTCSEINSLVAHYNAPYKFVLNKTIRIDIKTISFEATDLHFSLDYSSVLKLLMGEQIYGEKKAGLRELLQNSIDAIMVMCEKLSDKMTSNYQPTIWIEMNKEKNIISVCDNGTGMSKAILEKYFFNIGKSYYTSNDYKKLNLNYSAIGHFGIGFLACFMLSSNVRMETQAVGQKPIVIEFEKTSQFVTKLKNPTCSFDEGHGTRIHLSYNEIIPTIFKDEKELADYVKKLLFINEINVKILNSLHETEIIKNSVSATYRHISTNDLDIYYSLMDSNNLWSDFSDIDFGYSYIFLYCNYNEFGNNDPFIVDLEDLDAFLDYYENNCFNVPFIDYLEGEKFSNPSIYLFLSNLGERTDTAQSIRMRINNYIFNKIYKNESLVCHFYSHETIPYDWEDIGWHSNNYNESVVLIGFENFDMPSYLYELPFKIKEDLKNNHRIDIEKFYYGPEKVELDVLKAKNANVFMPIESSCYMSNRDIYMHGIRVGDASFHLPYSIFNSNQMFERIIVNVKTDKFELNVSRKDFVKSSKEKLERDVAKEIFKDIAGDYNNSYNDIERSLITELVEMIDSD